jgi:hypothetical protein
VIVRRDVGGQSKVCNEDLEGPDYEWNTDDVDCDIDRIGMVSAVESQLAEDK